MQLFFSQKIIDGMIVLDKVESNHCMNVLRYSLNDEVNIVDGIGNLYIGSILEVNNNECYVKIEETIHGYNKKDYHLHLAISPTKNHSRIEWFIEKSIEIGVDEISFLNCSRTLRKNIRMSRISKIAKTAMKQANKAKLPIINPILNFKDFIEKSNDNTFICHLNQKIEKNLMSYKSKFSKNHHSCVLIGPEGDFTKEEVDSALKHKIIEISLGDSILRTETAGILACHLLNLMNSLNHEK